MVTLWRVVLVKVKVTFCWVGVVYTIKSATVITNFILISVVLVRACNFSFSFSFSNLAQ